MKKSFRLFWLAGVAAIGSLAVAGCGGGSSSDDGLDTTARITFERNGTTNANLSTLSVSGSASDFEEFGVYAAYSPSLDLFSVGARQSFSTGQRGTEFQIGVQGDDPSAPDVGFDADFGDDEADFFYFEDTNSFTREWAATSGHLRVIYNDGRYVRIQFTDVVMTPESSTDNPTGTFTINGTFTYDEDDIFNEDNLRTAQRAKGTKAASSKITKRPAKW